MKKILYAHHYNYNIGLKKKKFRISLPTLTTTTTTEFFFEFQNFLILSLYNDYYLSIFQLCVCKKKI